MTAVAALDCHLDELSEIRRWSRTSGKVVDQPEIDTIGLCPVRGGLTGASQGGGERRVREAEARLVVAPLARCRLHFHRTPLCWVIVPKVRQEERRRVLREVVPRQRQSHLVQKNLAHDGAEHVGQPAADGVDHYHADVVVQSRKEGDGIEPHHQVRVRGYLLLGHVARPSMGLEARKGGGSRWALRGLRGDVDQELAQRSRKRPCGTRALKLVLVLEDVLGEDVHVSQKPGRVVGLKAADALMETTEVSAVGDRVHVGSTGRIVTVIHLAADEHVHVGLPVSVRVTLPLQP